MVRKRLLETTAPAPAQRAPKPPGPGKARVATNVAAKRLAPPIAISDDALAAQASKLRRARPPKTAPPDDDDHDDEIDAMSVTTFCKRHGISRAFFYYLQHRKRAPRTIEIGSRTLITREAAADWRKAREAATKRHPRPKRAPRPRHRAAPTRQGAQIQETSKLEAAE
jgi:predicted DNA-binding transcriptional regulator AlpA